MASPEMLPVPDNNLITCKFCLSEEVRTCVRCKSKYCAIHAAKFSPDFCKDCLTNLAAISERFQRTTTEYDALDDKLVTRTSSCRQLRLDGSDWVFVQAWLDQLNDEEQQEVYEFHYFILKIIEYDNETRKVKRIKKLASAPLSITTTKQTATKKVIQPVDMQKNLEKMGLPVAVIKAMLTAAGVTYKEPPLNGNQP